MRTRYLTLPMIMALAACGGGGSGGPSGPGNDNTPPVVTIVSPAANATTTGRSFNIQLQFSDANGSGVDPSSLSVTLSRSVGGVLTRRGMSSVRAANTELVPVIGNASASGASLTIPDSLGVQPGQVTMTVRVRDVAGNQTVATQNFTVAPSPAGIVLIDAAGSRGQRGVALDIGLRNPDAVAGAQLDINVGNAIASVDSAYVLDRATLVNAGGWAFVAPGRLRLALFDALGSSVVPGESVVVRLFVTVSGNATLGANPLTPSNAVVSTPGGQSVAVTSSGASLTVQ